MKFTVMVENFGGTLVTTSTRVSNELGVRHDHLLEKIDGYINRFKEINSPELSGQFYIPSKYKAANGKSNKNYLITKKGIAQLISGYNASVPIAFHLNVAYINKFEAMEKKLKAQAKAIAFQKPLDFKKIRSQKEKGILLFYARDIYLCLEIGRNFSDWIDSRIGKYGFIEGIDYFKCEEISIRKVVERDYWVSIGMAKELSTIQNTLESRALRKYLLEYEQKIPQTRTLSKKSFSEREIELMEKDHKTLKEYLDRIENLSREVQQAGLTLKTLGHEGKAFLHIETRDKISSIDKPKQLKLI